MGLYSHSAGPLVGLPRARELGEEKLAPGTGWGDLTEEGLHIQPPGKQLGPPSRLLVSLAALRALQGSSRQLGCGDTNGG